MSERIVQNLESVRARMSLAARRAGRPPEEIELVAVTKHRQPEEIKPLIAAGQRILGENRVAEAVGKIEWFRNAPPAEPPPLAWHLIGHLQTNKARKIVGKTALIHGVDSLRLVEAIDRAAENADVSVDILLQLNVSGEESKFGLTAATLDAFARDMRPYERVRCRGLMTMAPWELEPEDTRPVFRDLRQALERLRDAAHEHIDPRHLSMGMTNDFEIAIEEGATLVRVGRALFE